MKIERKESEKKYPYFGKSDKGNVVLFTEPGKGTVLVKGDSTLCIGYVSRSWSEEEFIPVYPFEEEEKKPFVPIVITLDSEDEYVSLLKLFLDNDSISDKHWRTLKFI